MAAYVKLVCSFRTRVLLNNGADGWRARNSPVSALSIVLDNALTDIRCFAQASSWWA